MGILEEKFREILKELGHDTDTEGLIDTPKRVITYFKDRYKRITEEDRVNFIKSLTTFSNEGSGMIILKDIDFYSNCLHHGIIFYGKAHIGYIPKDRIFGISKLARIVDFHAKTLQIQENFTKDIIETIVHAIEPIGCGIVVEAVHLCMRARGVEKQNTVMITSEMWGNFMDSAKVRDEFLRLIGK